jgi:hypothetical protein
LRCSLLSTDIYEGWPTFTAPSPAIAKQFQVKMTIWQKWNKSRFISTIIDHQRPRPNQFCPKQWFFSNLFKYL